MVPPMAVGGSTACPVTTLKPRSRLSHHRVLHAHIQSIRKLLVLPLNIPQVHVSPRPPPSDHKLSGKSKPSARSRLLTASQSPPVGSLRRYPSDLSKHRSDGTPCLKLPYSFPCCRRTKSLRANAAQSLLVWLFPLLSVPAILIVQLLLPAAQVPPTRSALPCQTWPPSPPPLQLSLGSQLRHHFLRALSWPQSLPWFLCINCVPYLQCNDTILGAFDQCLSSPLGCRPMAAGVLLIRTPAPNDTLAHNRCTVCWVYEWVNGSAPCDDSHLSLTVQNFITDCEATVTGLHKFAPKD